MREGWKRLVLVYDEGSLCLCRLGVGFPAASMRWCGLSKGQKVLCHREGVVIRLHVGFRNIIGQKASAVLLVSVLGLGAKAVRTLLTISLTNPPRALSATSAKTMNRMRITGGKHRPLVPTYLDSRYRITQSIRGTDSYENLNVTMGRQGLDSYKGHPSLNATVLHV